MKLLNNIHVSDNSAAVPRDDPAFDKLRKIRPLLTKMNDLFQNNAAMTYSQSIDEAMILFKGRSSIRQYMPLKPTKRGYKVWVRADSKSGYVYQFEIYTGKDESGVTLGLDVQSALDELAALREAVGKSRTSINQQCAVTFGNGTQHINIK